MIPGVTAFAALSGPLPKAGVIAVALLVAVVLLGHTPKTRAWAMLGALVLAPVLLLADIWDSPQLRTLHHHPLFAAVGIVLALAVVAAIAVVIARNPSWLAPLAVAAVPFRSRSRPGGRRPTCWCPCTSSSPPARWRSSSRRC